MRLVKIYLFHNIYIVIFLKQETFILATLQIESLHGEKDFHIKNYLLEMPPSHIKRCLKSLPRKQLFNGKSYMKKLYTKL